MKKNLLFALAVIFFMASCSSKISLVKRKYNKGFYVAVNKKNPASPVTETAKASPQVVQEAVPVEIVAAAKPAETSPKVSPNTPGFRAAIPAQASQKPEAVKETRALTAAAQQQLVSPSKSVRPLSTRVYDSISGASGATDTNLVLLIILSLFPILSLIAVYLHDGSITLNFWITLLLHFLFLYWLFALLVVLDVINLA